MGYTICAYERETTLTFNDEEGTASVYSASPKWIRKLDRLCSENPNQFQCIGESKVAGEVVGKFYLIDKGLVSIRSRTRHRELSEEQRLAQAERMRTVNDVRGRAQSA